MSASALLSLPTLKLSLNRLADELSAPARSHQGVDPVHERLRQADLRSFDAERRASHPTRTSRYRFFRQVRRHFRYRLLTTITDTAYINGTGYGDKQMTRREALQKMIDEAQAKVARAQARGQWAAAARHLARVERLLRSHDNAAA